MKFLRYNVLIIVAAILAIGAIFMVTGCTTNGSQSLEGLLRNIDSINGTITVVTSDNQTHVIIIDSKTQISVDGHLIAFEALDPGTHIEVELESNNSNAAGTVAARLAKVEGTITQFQNRQLTIAPEHGGAAVNVSVDNDTRIKLGEERTGTMSDLTSGAHVEVKYDPETGKAIKVYVNSLEEADIEGVVTQVNGNQFTVEGEHGRTLTLTIDSATRFEDGTLADIDQGTNVEVKFDPVSLIAYRVELKNREDRSREENFTAHLSGAQEVPAVDSLGQGEAIFHLSDDGMQIEFKLIVANTANITMSHIHLAPHGQNGQPVIWLYPSSQTPQLIEGVFEGTLAEGKINGSDLVGPLAGQPLGALIDKMMAGETYVNVHTEQNPGGEIRGQIQAGTSNGESNGESENDFEDNPETAPAVPHILQGRENCLACHGLSGIEPFPANHAGRTNETCIACHQP